MKRAQRAAGWGASLTAVVALHAGAWIWLSARTPVMVVAPSLPIAMAVDMVPAPLPIPAPPVVTPPPIPAPLPAPEPAILAPVVAPPSVPAPVAPAVDDALPVPPPVPPKPKAVAHRRPSPPPPAAPRDQAVRERLPVARPVPPSSPSAPVPMAVRESWQSRLLGRLVAFRRYPADAVARGDEGTAYVRVAIAADGAVDSATLVQSSGHAALDAEALAWLHRAAPLPASPDGRVTVVVPLRFHLDAED